MVTDEQMDEYLEDLYQQDKRFEKLQNMVNEEAYERIMNSRLRDRIIKVILGKDY